MYLRTFGRFQSANHKKGCVRKPQFHKVPNLRKVRKSNKFADLQFAELISVLPTVGCIQILW